MPESECPFGRVMATKIKVAFFSSAVIYKFLLPTAKPLARNRQNPTQRFDSAFFRVQAPSVCHVICLKLNWPGSSCFWQLHTGLIYTGVYLMRKATYVGLRSRVVSSSILTANVWNSPRAHEPASDHHSF